jgi:hypothetical protein
LTTELSSSVEPLPTLSIAQIRGLSSTAQNDKVNLHNMKKAIEKVGGRLIDDHGIKKVIGLRLKTDNIEEQLDAQDLALIVPTAMLFAAMLLGTSPPVRNFIFLGGELIIVFPRIYHAVDPFGRHYL